MSSQDPENPMLDLAVFAAENKTPEGLAQVLDLLKTLQVEGKLKEAAEIHADASREDEWRTPLGESRVLAFFQGILASAQKDSELGPTCSPSGWELLRR